MSKEPYTIVYLLGSGRTGSTVLDLMLAGHPNILALGEISSVFIDYDPFKPPEDDVVARHSWGPHMSFWTEVSRQFEESTGRPFREIDLAHPRLRKALQMRRAETGPWISANLALFRAVHAASTRPVLSDASKVPQRLLLLRRSQMFRIKVLHLVRDGRAVCHSYSQRYGAFYGGMRTWATAEIMALFLHRLFPADQWFEVRYETLATFPAETLREICLFLELEYDDAMLDLQGHEYLGIAGNPKVRATRPALVRRDDRWQAELGISNRVAFGLIAGWLNRLNGYPAFASKRRTRSAARVPS